MALVEACVGGRRATRRAIRYRQRVRRRLEIRGRRFPWKTLASDAPAPRRTSADRRSGFPARRACRMDIVSEHGPCESGDRELERRVCGQVAQLVEQWTENPCVAGSIPALSTPLAIRSIRQLRSWVDANRTTSSGILWPSTKKAVPHSAERLLALNCVGRGRRPCTADQTMSLSFFRARTFTTFFAGLAATSISSPGLNGLGTPLRAG